MSRVMLKSLLLSPVALVATLLVSAGAIAAPGTTSYGAETKANNLSVEKLDAASLQSTDEVAVEAMPATSVKVAQAAPSASENQLLDQINKYSREGNQNSSSIDQVTNVSQFSDVRPGDWAYESLRQLVERYGCIAGYPDGTYRGNRAMTRYEFAAGLNSCLQQIEKLIAASTADFASKEDLETLRRLTQEFQAELATLGTRVDKLEGRVGFLEAHQFSTTTKLVGEAIFALTDNFGKTNRDRDRADNTVFGDRVRLDLQTSFTGKDKLHTRLAAGNLSAFLPQNTINGVSGTGLGAEGTQTFDLHPSGSNAVGLDWLAYEFPFGSSQVYLAATGGLFADFAPTNNPYFDNGDGGSGALSTFAQYSPIYRLGGGAGAGVRLGVGRTPILGPTSLTVGYLADDGSANNPGTDLGLFNGDYAALAQLNFNVSDRLGIAATYVHGYHNTQDGFGNNLFDIGSGTGVVGTQAANLLNAADPRAGNGTNFINRSNPTVTNSYGIQAALRLSSRFSVSGFVGKTDANVIGTSAKGDIWYYGLGIAMPDLGKKGNLAGIFAGVEPYLNGAEVLGNSAGIRADRSYHVEGFYKYQLTENISITPGVIWITAPNQNDNNQDAVIGTLRTTFTF